MKRTLLSLTFAAAMICGIATGCGNDDCYSEALYQEHKDDVCTMDCPGFTGCDGKVYCNECIALTQGIGAP